MRSASGPPPTALLQAVWDAAPDALALSDPQGVVLDVNPAYCALYGYPREELVGQSFAVIFPPEQRASAEEQYQQVFQGSEAPPPFEAQIRRRDGQPRWVESRVSFLTEEGQRLAMLSIVRDVTARIRAEVLQRETLAMITHDLRTPLTSILGYAELLPYPQADVATVAERIVGQARHLARLIRDLSDYSRLATGQLQLDRQSVDLVALVEGAIEHVQARTTHHQLRLTAPPGPLEGFWDRDRVQQVIENLLANAVKYTPEGGPIAVQVSDLGSEVQVSVSDPGAGIAADALPHLFDRFYRAEATAERTEGQGLGLAIAQGLVEAHGGRLEAESAGLGQGSTFRFTLPRGAPTPA